jgi:hypothetical protein
MAQIRKYGFLHRRFGHMMGCFDSAAVRACLALCLLLTPVLLCAQTQGPLTLEQVRNLIKIGAPDATVAHEIQARGIAFTPDRDLLSRLENQHAGAKTLAALRDFLPMLDEAKKQVPQLLQSIYSALDQGNLISVRSSMSNDLASNTAKLDMICKPFTYRSHYVEAIIERPQKRFEVRVRVLFKPLEERAYVLWFGLGGGNFQLQDVAEPPQDWFQAEFSASEQTVRKFVYAVNAGRNDVAQQIVTPGLVARLTSSNVLAAIRSSQISQVSTQQLGIWYYKGLKIRNEIWVHENGKMCCTTYVFLLDPLPEDPRIVAWRGAAGNSTESEDPTLEYATLKRFGISATPPVEPQVANAQTSTAPVGPQSAVVAQQGDALRFNVRHRHKPGFIVSSPEAGQTSFCSGVLTIDKGAVQYYCTQPDIPKNRCERVTITGIKDVKYQENGLRIAAHGGSWDFFLDDQGQLAAAHDAVAATIK